MTSLRSRVLAGLGWSGATQAAVQLFQFGFSIALARVLIPADFGLVGMVAVFTGFASSLGDLGLGASLIQKPSLSERHLDSVFWLNVAVGAVLASLFGLTAPLVARFYGEPRLVTLTTALAFSFLLGSLSGVHGALLSKSIDFRARFRIESVSVVVSGSAALLLALAGAGVWSLVGQALVMSATRTAMSWRLVRWRPAWSFDAAAVRELLHFARHLVAFSTVVYWENNLEKMVIGRAIGSSPLGAYSFAERMMRIPSTNITGTAGGVMFPALSLIQADIESVKRAYLRSTRLIATLTFPAMMGMLVLAEPLILSLVGEKWRASINLLQLLCVAGIAQSVYNTSGWLYLSRGRPELLLRSSIYALLARAAGVLIGIRWGILGIVYGYVVGVYGCVLYTTWASAGRLIGLRMRDLLRNVSGPFFCAAGMALIVALIERELRSGQPSWIRVAIGAPAGVVVYVSLVRLVWNRGWDEMLQLLRDIFRPRQGSEEAVVTSR